MSWDMTVTGINLLVSKCKKYLYYIRFYTVKTCLHDRYKVDFSPNNCVAVYYLKR